MYARNKIDFTVAIGVYMIPSDTNLYFRKILNLDQPIAFSHWLISLWPII